MKYIFIDGKTEEVKEIYLDSFSNVLEILQTPKAVGTKIEFNKQIMLYCGIRNENVDIYSGSIIGNILIYDYAKSKHNLSSKEIKENLDNTR